ncbi:hypothetical protein V8C86DRAFT_2764473, partial [Haematococcus lacustris]
MTPDAGSFPPPGRSVRVLCNNVPGLYLVDEQAVLCACATCVAALPPGVTPASPRTWASHQHAISPTEYERHSGMASTRKWRHSIKVDPAAPGQEGTVGVGGAPISVGKWLDSQPPVPRTPVGPAKQGGSAQGGLAGSLLQGRAAAVATGVGVAGSWGGQPTGRASPKLGRQGGGGSGGGGVGAGTSLRSPELSRRKQQERWREGEEVEGGDGQGGLARWDSSHPPPSRFRPPTLSPPGHTPLDLAPPPPPLQPWAPAALPQGLTAPGHVAMGWPAAYSLLDAPADPPGWVAAPLLLPDLRGPAAQQPWQWPDPQGQLQALGGTPLLNPGQPGPGQPPGPTLLLSGQQPHPQPLPSPPPGPGRGLGQQQAQGQFQGQGPAVSLGVGQGLGRGAG